MNVQSASQESCNFGIDRGVACSEQRLEKGQNTHSLYPPPLVVNVFNAHAFTRNAASTLCKLFMDFMRDIFSIQ